MNTMPRLHRYAYSALALGLSLAGAAQAQNHDHGAHPAPAQAPAAAQVDHSGMHHSKMDHSNRPVAKPAAAKRSAAKPPAAKPDAAKPASGHDGVDHNGMDHGATDHSGTNHSGMNHDAMNHGGANARPMDHRGHAGSATPSAAGAEPREPIPQPTDADRAAAFPPITQHMQHAPEFNHFVLFNRLEAIDAEHGDAQAWEGQAWFGSDTDRLWLRSEGEREDGRVEDANLEALYGRAISPWWDVVVGARHDFRPRSGQTWAAIGLQGMSPYKFEVSATAYIGESGRTALNFEAEYELLLTNRLILQPLIEVDLYGRDDPQRGTGAGLSSLEAGLRLRYEITRQFAPYVGVSWERAFGDTADYRRAAGEGRSDASLVAGVRVWF